MLLQWHPSIPVMAARKSHALVALCAIASLLFMQLAVAAYTCPHDHSPPAADVVQDEPACDQMDRANPALCHAHCQQQAQSLDKPVALTIPAAMPSGLRMALVQVAAAFVVSAKDQLSLLARSTAPPLAIRHCCLRI